MNSVCRFGGNTRAWMIFHEGVILSGVTTIELNSIIRNSDILQDVILNVGLGKKYWNTIIPLLNTGSVDNVINYKYN